MSSPASIEQPDAAPGWLPGFCSVNALLILVVTGELLALLLVLIDTGLGGLRWVQLGLVSAEVQWVALGSAALLCRLRPALARLRPALAAFLSYILVMAVTLVIATVGQWLLKDVGRGYIDWAQVANHLAISAIMTGLIFRYLILQERLRRQQQANLQARLQALQARIEPHFLFNSMNSIASLIAVDPDRAERVVEDLAELFRASLAEPALIPAARELELCHAYMRIEQLRLGERLQLDWQVASLPREAALPNRSLQPILENAIFHGVEPFTGGGRIELQARADDEGFEVRISNTLEPGGKRSRRGHHMAMNNIRDRLAAHFGEGGSLTIERSPERFTAIVRVDDASARRALASHNNEDG